MPEYSGEMRQFVNMRAGTGWIIRPAIRGRERDCGEVGSPRSFPDAQVFFACEVIRLYTFFTQDVLY